MNGNVIVYDLDGTLTKRDSMVAFTHFTHGRLKSSLIYFLLSPIILLAFTSLVSRQYVKELLLKLHYKGMKYTDLLILGQRFANEKMPSLLHKSIFLAMKTQLVEGNIVVVLSASCDIWVEPWCKLNEVQFLGSKLEFINGACTGKLLGKNCKGEEKVRVLSEFLCSDDYECLKAYGNEKSDLHFMKLATKQFYVHKGKVTEL